MRLHHFTFIFVLVLFACNIADALQTKYPYNPLVPAEYWIQAEPYFLPFDHPLKSKLDRLFRNERVTESPDSFAKGGFGKVKLSPKGNLVVGRSRELSGYLIKAFLDVQAPVCEWCNWIKRIEGANAIRNALQRHGFTDFVVPRKWIYPLPQDPSPMASLSSQRKNFILVVEDMRILSNKENLKAYKKKITQKHLDQLYILFSELGLLDSVYPDNIPFTVKGTIAFIDTEHHHHKMVPYHVLSHYLSPSMQTYWNSLTK